MASTMHDFAAPTVARRSTSVLARFTTAPTMTTDQYDASIRRLKGSGDWPAEGLAYHVAFMSAGNLRISEIWDSQEQFDAYGKRLLSGAGIELVGEPEVVGVDNPEMLEVHNIVQR
jgi:hypothetical protein